MIQQYKRELRNFETQPTYKVGIRKHRPKLLLYLKNSYSYGMQISSYIGCQWHYDENSKPNSCKSPQELSNKKAG